MNTSLLQSISRLGQQLDTHKKGAVLINVALDSLQPYARQSRHSFDQESLNELAQTIAELGVLEPLLVRPIDGGRYEIIAGERRWRAARIAGLVEVPVLVKTFDDDAADKAHLFENIHRENLSNIDLALRVKNDLLENDGNLSLVAAKYHKTKSWVSKLSTIADGGDVMAELVQLGATADRAVLSTVAALERKAPAKAKELGKRLLDAGASDNKRLIAQDFMKSNKAEAAPKETSTQASKPSKPKKLKTPEPDWRNADINPRAPASMCVLLELSPHSHYVDEFKELSAIFGAARLNIEVHHPHSQYVAVNFGPSNDCRRMYEAQDLRLLNVI